MGFDEWIRRRRKSIFDVIDEMIRDMLREFEELAALSPEDVRYLNRPIVYGFRLEIGPDGVPRIYEFGNITREGSRGKITVSEETEPLTDIYDEGDRIRIIMEMPGVEKEKIKVKAIDDRHIVVEASDTDRRYRKEIELPSDVDIESAKATYKNGILELILKKKSSSKREKIIEVE